MKTQHYDFMDVRDNGNDDTLVGAVLAHIQQQHEELEKQNKRSRAKKSMPSRKAQKAVIEQRNLNPVLDSCS